jgi:hypothetical protein
MNEADDMIKKGILKFVTVGVLIKVAGFWCHSNSKRIVKNWVFFNFALFEARRLILII